jgi:class 3 adenylate cyclase
MGWSADLRALLSEVRAPTLVLHRSGSQTVPVSHGRYLAEHIPGAIYRELPGDDSLFFVGDVDGLLAEIEEFLTGARHAHRTTRVVSTILFSDLVESTSTAARLGDQHWHDLLEAHNAAVRRQLERFDGREVDTTGDGFFAMFDGPAQAIRCAEAMHDVVGRLGLEMRIGIHTGQIELTETGVVGLGVHIGQRVSSLASSGEILVSRTVVDLLAGPASRSPTAENTS